MTIIKQTLSTKLSASHQEYILEAQRSRLKVLSQVNVFFHNSHYQKMSD